MVGSIFRLEIRRDEPFDDTRICVVRMKLCGDDNNDLKELYDHIKNEDERREETNRMTLNTAIWRMDKFDLAEKYFRRCLSELPSNDPLLSELYQRLGLVADSKARRAQFSAARSPMNTLCNREEKETFSLIFTALYCNRTIMKRVFIRDCPNGRLDKKKFQEVYAKFYPQGDQLSFAFDLYDIFDDGLIDQTELYELNGGIHDRTGDHNPKTRAAEIIASLDVSGDKKLCKEEFISGCKSDPYLREIFAPNV
ncbi:unnamed protein product [Rotaria socialis]|uniref:Uncharacterized protein n=2 Tax=Rotaria socialis TaxID=392032 RepID=A0A821LTW4_9BILA|nr:unnamed protein product [Rotaria socialis]CAF4757041.1 unnamed protein product [Rotaria socialis]